MFGLMKLRNNIVRYISVTLLISVVFSVCSCIRNDNGFDGIRFSDTRHITVAVDGKKWKELYTDNNMSDFKFSNSSAAVYIHDQVLKDCNIDIKFVDSNTSSISNGTAADISYSSDVNVLNTYYRMNSIIDMKPYLENYKESLPDLWSLLGDENVYSCDSFRNEVWYITPREFDPESSITFIRSDWLVKLGLESPKTREELHNCLIAFRDNAELLLGEDASSMIPFFIDCEPNISAKPLFDSCLDTSINDKEFFINGYCRTTQKGYLEGLEILNSWYLEDLLPADFTEIRPNTKEAYEPIEKGYVGAFCSKYDYLYKNGEDSLIRSLHKNCGDDACFIAVNTFENINGDYTCWQEDYIKKTGRNIYLPATCSDPLACLVYLNWISNESHIDAVQQLRFSNPDDPFSYERYLLTCHGLFPDGEYYEDSEAEKARQTALDVKYIHRGSLCVGITYGYLEHLDSEIDYASAYPGSTQSYVCSVISAPLGEFDSVYKIKYTDYLNMHGAYLICIIRQNQWEQVIEQGDLSIW